ncbi:MAG: 50S ribosomal protein L23 [Chitinophagales bacterium]|jgi:large subunit ribosomal protein L23
MQGTKRVLIKPLVTEKSNMITEKQGKYVFEVARTSSKDQIKAAVEDYFNVKVDSVNTSITPGKLKSKMTKKGMVEGRKSAKKKAYITLKEGTIDIYN